jgi:hypothetical protein
MKKTLLTLVAFAAVLGAGTATAGATVGQWTAGAGGLWTNTDSDRGLDDGAVLSVSVGYAMSEKWDVGMNIFSGKLDVNGAAGKVSLKGLTFDFNRVFSRDQRVSPYLLVGAGIVDQFRPGLSVADKEVVAKFGGGAVADLVEFGSGNKLQVKMEAAARTTIGRHLTDITGSLGLQVAFGVGGN